MPPEGERAIIYDYDDDNDDDEDADDDDIYDVDDDNGFSKTFFCRTRIVKAPLECYNVFHSFPSTCSGYGKSRPAGSKAGPKSFMDSNRKWLLDIYTPLKLYRNPTYQQSLSPSNFLHLFFFTFCILVYSLVLLFISVLLC